MLLNFRLMLFFDCYFKNAQNFQQEIICRPSKNLSTYCGFKWEFDYEEFSNTWSNLGTKDDLTGTLTNILAWKQQKTFWRGWQKDRPSWTSNRRVTQYVFCSFQTEPHLYVPKRTSYVRTFFVPVFTGKSMLQTCPHSTTTHQVVVQVLNCTLLKKFLILNVFT